MQAGRHFMLCRVLGRVKGEFPEPGQPQESQPCPQAESWLMESTAAGLCCIHQQHQCRPPWGFPSEMREAWGVHSEAESMNCTLATSLRFARNIS